MTISAQEREQFIRRYAAGPAGLRAAWERVPVEARQWRPAPGAFSAHEVVCHCADSETNGAARIRYVVAEPEPLVLGYDENAWARIFDYHSHPVEAALATVEAVRANTVPLLSRLADAAWQKVGRHTESGRYAATDWLAIYAAHLEEHAGQIERIIAAWPGASGPATAHDGERR